MTGYQSKKAAALDEDGMYLVHHTQPASLNGYIKKIENLIQERDTWKAAAQRPWVGLTDEQIADYLGDEYHDITESELRFFRLGEVAAKEKNNGCDCEEPDELTIAYMSGLYDGKKAALAGRERNFCERCGKRTADLTVIHTCTPPQEIYENRKN